MERARVRRSATDHDDDDAERATPARPRPDPEAGAPSPRKLGLSFILNDHRLTAPSEDASSVARETVPPGRSPLDAATLTRQLEQTCSIDGAVAPRNDESGETVTSSSVPSTATPPTPRARSTSKKRGRMCKADGCENYIVHKGLCCRHGGGKKCSVEGCDSSAKHGGRCWKHGGSIECKIPECTKKAKARGLCWAHGGGAKCTADACTKVAISSGFCWAHGGGKRCIFDGCQRPAFERTHSFCLRHYDALQDADYYEV